MYRMLCFKTSRLIVFALSLPLFISLDLRFRSGFSAPLVLAHSHSHDHHGCDHDHHHHEEHAIGRSQSLLPEELAEEEDMKLYGFSNFRHHDHSHSHGQSPIHGHGLNHTGVGLWLHALGCSLLVSLASLVCLIIFPIIFIQGKPSKAVVDSLALFGAGAMLGDAFLHQLPHAFDFHVPAFKPGKTDPRPLLLGSESDLKSCFTGGEHSHSHDHDTDHSHHSHAGHGHSHAHSLKDLSVGLSVLAGIVLFLLVEKVVRYVEANSSGAHSWGHGHHHHHHNSSKKLKDDDAVDDVAQSHSTKETTGKASEETSGDSLNGVISTENESHLRKRKTTADDKNDKSASDAADRSSDAKNSSKTLSEKETFQAPSNLVFGYLNLFSDGVHNFTDGMALGSAFLLYGSVGGWSRTLFLLAHELPQEIGDFGILIRSGFSAPKALFFNFLSALLALAGTALALLWGRDPGQSSLIEGFTAGGFIYIAVAGVLAEMNNGSSTIKSSVAHIISLTFGMAVALCISLVE